MRLDPQSAKNQPCGGTAIIFMVAEMRKRKVRRRKLRVAHETLKSKRRPCQDVRSGSIMLPC